MKFVREVVPTQDLDALRALGARDGWLIENSEVIRIGFGKVADQIELCLLYTSPSPRDS